MSTNQIVNVERTLKPSDHITGFIQYHVRAGRRKGVICAQYDHKMRMFRLGWSLCARNRGDKFNPVFGREMALNRMVVRGAWVDMTDLGVQDYALRVPCSMDKDYMRVVERLALIHNKSLAAEKNATVGLVEKIACGIGNAVRRIDEIVGVDAASNHARVTEASGVRI